MISSETRKEQPESCSCNLSTILNSKLAKLRKSKIIDSDSDFKYQEIDLEKLLSTIKIHINENIKNKISSNIDTFNYTLESKISRCIYTNEKKLHKALINLILNFIKFNDGCPIMLNASLISESNNSKLIKFTIYNSIISNQESIHIFQKYIINKQSVTNKLLNTRFRTKVSENIVNELGGKMGIEESKNNITNYWFIIPYRPHNISVKSDICKNMFKILVAEYIETNRTLMKIILEKAGYEVDISSNGLTAIDYCSLKKYDLVLLDTQMPDIDSYDVTQKIKCVNDNNGPNKDTPIIALTSFQDNDLMSKYFALGTDDYIIKPVKREILLTKIEDILNHEKNTGKDIESKQITYSHLNKH